MIADVDRMMEKLASEADVLNPAIAPRFVFKLKPRLDWVLRRFQTNAEIEELCRRVHVASIQATESMKLSERDYRRDDHLRHSLVHAVQNLRKTLENSRRRASVP